MVYAGFWRRFAAVFIDGLILVIPSSAITYGLLGGSGLFGNVILGFIVGCIYHPLFWSSPLQATPGKAIMGVAVVKENGDALLLKEAIIRYLSMQLSGLIMCLGYIISVFTAKRQTLHDIIASTVVVMKTAPEVNYFQIWLAEIKKISGDPTAGSNIFKTTTDASAAKAIEDLHKLYQSGAITQAEYDLKKAELLKKI